jgi:alkanesulfonate monooxygenase SsuD/methylene tetrahydromethanopterin reductase-like flavin-dependent oxidoreductase (luciferase family)
VRLGTLILPERRWSDAQRRWQRAEELGLAHAWTYDHVNWGPLRDGAWFGSVPTLAAAALVTSTIRLGTLVASPNIRHPVVLARDLLALDDLSDGRFTFGVGAGSEGWDATVLGQAPWSRRERADRFEEFVELTDLLLREPEVRYAGRFWSALEARGHPGCVQQPRLPFAVAASGRRGMRLAARYGQAWVTTGDRGGPSDLDAEVGAKAVAAQVRQLEEACGAVGRDPATIDRIVVTGPLLDPGYGSVASFRHTVGCYADAGATDLVVHWPRSGPPFEGDEAAFEAAMASIGQA